MATNLIVGTHAIAMRVQLRPHLDHWMMGDRYGEIVKVTRKSIHVHMDKSGKTIRLLPDQFTYV